jgi:HEAT repeat protein
MKPSRPNWGLVLAGTATLGMSAFLAIRWTTPAEQPADRSMAELVELLRDPSTAVRREASFALSRGGPGTVAVMGPLLDALEDPDLLVRSQVAVALGRIGPPVVDRLVELLAHPGSHVRRSAAEALSLIGPPATPAVGRLIEL